MKNIKFLVLGIFFAIVLSKVQAISWFRFYEMFKFQSFHMFGIIGGAVIVSAMIMQLFKRGIIKDINGDKIVPKQKKKGKLLISHRYNLIPLLHSCPGGVHRELVVQDLPLSAKIVLFFSLQNISSVLFLCIFA